MIRVLRSLREELLGFIDGQDYGVCLLRGEAEHLPFVYRLLAELEDESHDIFMLFPHPCSTLVEYANTILERVTASGREAYGDSWSPPRDCQPGGRPIEGVKGTLVCARAMLPKGSETPRLVPVLVPLEARGEGYLELVRAFAASGSAAPPWFRRMRVFLHIEPDVEVERGDFVCELEVDLSLAAQLRRVEEAVDDPRSSREERVQALLQAAMIDVGNSQMERAVERFDEAYRMGESLEAPLFKALALCGLGDIERLGGECDAAIGWYERALAPAAEFGAPIVLLMISRHLADLYLTAGRAADAETFFDGAQRLAGVIPEPESRCGALIGRGVAQQRRGAPADLWAASFVRAAEVARDNDRNELLAECRRHLAESRGHRLPKALRDSVDALLGGSG